MTAPMPPLTAFEWQVMTRSEREHYLTAAFRPSTAEITASIDAETDHPRITHREAQQRLVDIWRRVPDSPPDPRWDALRMAYRAAVAKTLANP